MELQIGVSKINKYATSESGDTLEVVERPNGGISVVLADGQRSGKSAKKISNMVVRKVISLLAEGVRDGAAARAASDYLYAYKNGKVSSTLNIMSIDLESNTIVITKNNPAPIFIYQNSNISKFDEDSKPVGNYRNTRPAIKEIEITENLTIIAYTDGLIHAGDRIGKSLNVENNIQDLLENPKVSAQLISDDLLSKACALDDGRPIDDISVVAIQVLPKKGDNVRRMSIKLPLR